MKLKTEIENIVHSRELLELFLIYVRNKTGAEMLPFTRNYPEHNADCSITNDYIKLHVFRIQRDLRNNSDYAEKYALVLVNLTRKFCSHYAIIRITRSFNCRNKYDKEKGLLTGISNRHRISPVLNSSTQ